MVYIFTGRFQPFHKGHLIVLKRILEYRHENDLIVFAICTDSFEHSSCQGSFSWVVDEHYDNKRNPWDYLTVLSAIDKVISHYQLKNVLSILSYRPDYGIEQIRHWIPRDRIWVIPQTNELFDEQKAAFFRENGERILRICDTTSITGYKAREAYMNHDYWRFAKYVPEFLTSTYMMQ